MIDINNLLADFINPPQKGLLQKVRNKFKNIDERKAELRRRADKSIYIKDALKTNFWQEVLRPMFVDEIYNGIGKLLRPSALELSEREIKVILASVQANYSKILQMRYLVDNGDDSARELGLLEKEKP